MPDKMLIDATHPEETRVVVLRGNRVEEFDFESANRKQLRGNIYLAKVTRVEPSLQAAFVDYGGNRHGFLAFSEIHPDYYQIPVADRQALIAQEEHDARAADADADNRASRGRSGGRNRNRNARSDRPRDPTRSEPVATDAADQPPGESALGGLPAEQPGMTETPVSDAAPQEQPYGSDAPVADAHQGEPGHETAAETTAPLAMVEPEAVTAQAEEDAKDEAREAYEAPAGDIELPPLHTAAEAGADHDHDHGDHHHDHA
jgi:ribonuclease E